MSRDAEGSGEADALNECFHLPFGVRSNVDMRASFIGIPAILTCAGLQP